MTPHTLQQRIAWSAVRLALLLWHGAGVASGTDAEWFEALVDRSQTPGAVAVVVSGDHPPQLFAAGLCQADIPCTGDTQFPIGSVTKFVTGLLTTQLAVEGVVSLSRPIAEALPDLAWPDDRGSTVSLRDLLSQRSGIGAIDWPYYWDPTLPTEHLLARTTHVPVVRGFRDAWAYSNTNYAITGAVLQAASGQTWTALVEQRLFKPLGLQHAGFGVHSDGTQGHALVANAGRIAVPTPVPRANLAAGGIHWSGKDFGKVLKLLIDDGRVGTSTVVAPNALWFSRQVHAASMHDRRFFQGPSGYGLGVYTAVYRDDAVVHHPGAMAGFSTHFVWVPAQRFAVAVMSNLALDPLPRAAAFALVDRHRGRATDLLEAMLENDAPATPLDLGYEGPDPVGRYVHPGWGRLDIIDKSGRPWVQHAGMTAELRGDGKAGLRFAAAPGWEWLTLHMVGDAGAPARGLELDDGVHRTRFVFTRTSADD